MPDAARFPFSSATSGSRDSGALPFLPLALEYRGVMIKEEALLDTGATVNVLPYRLGEQLGAVWVEGAPTVQLTGNLAHCESQALLLTGRVAEFPPVRLAFAWT